MIRCASGLVELRILARNIDKPVITIRGQSKHRVISKGPLTESKGKRKALRKVHLAYYPRGEEGCCEGSRASSEKGQEEQGT